MTIIEKLDMIKWWYIWKRTLDLWFQYMLKKESSIRWILSLLWDTFSLLLAFLFFHASTRIIFCFSQKIKKKKVASIDSFRPNSSPCHFFVSCSSPRWFSRFVQVRNLKLPWNQINCIACYYVDPKRMIESSKRYVFSLHISKCPVWLNFFLGGGAGVGNKR